MSMFANQKREVHEAQDFVPHAYQQKAIEFCLANKYAGLFLDPGLGKTAISLSVIKSLKKSDEKIKVLVIAPLLVAHNVWPNETRKWKQFEDLTVHVLHGKDKRTDVDADIYVINPEGLPWLKDNWKSLPAFHTLVIDESTKFKHSNTKRFKLLKPLLPTFSRRYILTGSPAANGLLDLFGQMYVLDLGRSLGRYITHFRNRFFYPTGYGGYEWKLRQGGEQEIYELIAPSVMRLSAKDELDLPDLVENDIWIDLPPKVMKQYKELEDDMLLVLDEGIVTALNAGSVSNKCRQVSNGGLYIDKQDGTRDTAHLHYEKAQAVCNIIEEVGEGVLVLYEFRHDLDRLQREIKKVTGHVPPHLGGGVPASKAKQIVDDWNAGAIPVLLGHPASMGHGVNLQGYGSHVVFHSIPWDLELYEQAVARIYRQGVTSRVLVHHILSRGTVDRVVRSAIHAKDRTQQALLDALKNYRFTLSKEEV